MSEAPFLMWQSAGRTDVGKVRAVNEDACLDLPELGLWAVADGMGGHPAGDLASQAVVDQLERIQRPPDLDTFAADVARRLQSVNTFLRQEARRGGHATIGTTVAVLVAFGHRCACLWAGDSRIYRLRGGVVERLTRDHSAVEDYIAAGMSRREAEAGPWGNYITRAVGAHDALEVETARHDLADGDVFLLCSDGLYREVGEHELPRLLAAPRVSEAARHLVDLALQRGARDNVTVVVVRFVRPA